MESADEFTEICCHPYFVSLNTPIVWKTCVLLAQARVRRDARTPLGRKSSQILDQSRALTASMLAVARAESSSSLSSVDICLRIVLYQCRANAIPSQAGTIPIHIIPFQVKLIPILVKIVTSHVKLIPILVKLAPSHVKLIPFLVNVLPSQAKTIPYQVNTMANQADTIPSKADTIYLGGVSLET